MKPLRCLIADIPQKVLADIVQTLTQQDKNIEMVGRMNGADDIDDIVERQAIDVLISGMEKSTAQTACCQFMEKFPDLLIIGLLDDGRMAVACMGSLGKDDLLNLIRIKSKADTGMTI